MYCTNIIRSFKDIMLDVYAIMLQKTSSFTDASFLWDFPPRLAAYQVPNKHKVCCCSSRLDRPLPSCLSVHCWLRWYQFYSATCPDCFCSTFYAEIPVAVIKSEILVADSLQVAPLCYKFNQFRVNRCVQKKTVMCAKNHTSWFTCFVRRAQSNAEVSVFTTRHLASAVYAVAV